MKLFYDEYQAPFGLIRVIMEETGLKRVAITPEYWEQCKKDFGEIKRDEEGCRQAIIQLQEYFSGKRYRFTVSFSDIEGPEFSQKVWQALRDIPFGETRSYTEVAQTIGNPKGCRAVGQANRRNPLPIFIPCHRVIGKKGELTGYAGKGYLAFKEYLLYMERKYKIGLVLPEPEQKLHE